MAFVTAGFRTVAQGGTADSAADNLGMSLHLYITDDALATVAASGYYNAVEGNIKSGDIVIVSGDFDGTNVHQTYVLVNTAGVITSIASA